MGDSKIEWTEKTWNPVTGCSKVSQGCKNCYAERLFPKVYPGRDFTDVRTHEDRLDAPLHWRKPARIFVNSMSDLFHEKVPFEFIDKVFAVMALATQHTFQILTKRPERMLKYLSGDYSDRIEELIVFDRYGSFAYAMRALTKWTPDEYDDSDGAHRVSSPGYWDWEMTSPLPNVWLGVSVEDQKTADERIPLLLRTPAAVRWVSYEPALGPVDFTNLRYNDGEGPIALDALRGVAEVLESNSMDIISDDPDNPRLDWIVCGGESGPKARPMHPDWARSVRDQCQAAGVPYFFKQWGSYKPASPINDDCDDENRAFLVTEDGKILQADERGRFNPLATFNTTRMVKVSKKEAGRSLDGRTWDQYPKVSVSEAR